LEGLIKIEIKPEDETNAQKIIRNANENELLLKTLSDSIKYLLSDMSSVSNRFNEVSSILTQLNTNSQQFHTKDITNSYDKLSSLFLNWSKTYQNQSKVINQEIREFFNFTKKEMRGIKDLISEYEQSKQDYMAFETKLRSKKEELFLGGNFLKWEMTLEDSKETDKAMLLKDKPLAFSKMLPKETMISHSHRRNFAFHMSALNSEYLRLLKIQNKKYLHHFKDLASRQTEFLADIFQMAKLLNFNP